MAESDEDDEDDDDNDETDENDDDDEHDVDSVPALRHLPYCCPTPCLAGWLAGHKNDNDKGDDVDSILFSAEKSVVRHNAKSVVRHNGGGGSNLVSAPTL